MTRTQDRARRLSAARGVALLALAVACTGLGAQPVTAQKDTASKAAIDIIRNSKRASQKLLDDKQQRQLDLRADMKSLRKDRERLSRRLVETAKAIQNSEAQVSLTEEKLSKLEAEETILRGALAQQHGTIAKLLAAMQRMGRNPPPVMITRRKDALKMVRSAMLLAATFPELRGKALALASRLKQLQKVVDTSRRETLKLKAENKRLEDTRISLAALMEEKRQSLGERQAELAALQRDAREIKRTVGNLADLISRLDRAVAARTRLGSYNIKQKAKARAAAVIPAGRTPDLRIAKPADEKVAPKAGQRVAALTVPKPKVPSPSGTAPDANEGRGTDSVLMTPGRNISLIDPGRLQPAIPFARAKGRLPRPAQGRQVVSFGEKTQYGARSKGIVIATRYAAQITAPSDGWVVYAGEFRSYGQLLIINAGQEYHILLAGMSQIDVQLGQFVLAGEPVGTMSAAARRKKSRSQKSAPVLYVEFRKDGRPVNPGPWWAKDSRKVQG